MFDCTSAAGNVTSEVFLGSETVEVLLQITEGGHASEDQVNKQLHDKERVAAALENLHLLSMVDKCLATTEPKQTKI